VAAGLSRCLHFLFWLTDNRNSPTLFSAGIVKKKYITGMGEMSFFYANSELLKLMRTDIAKNGSRD
tara:strand:- start:185 stop:382 length:198 start_codon:yes stop_codon:yes gene_type:complete